MMDQITQTDLFSAIVKQSPLNESQLNQMVSNFKKTYSYENELHILKLIAQENRVELGTHDEYLYMVLKYENGPTTMFFIPFTTIEKSRVNEIIRNDISESFHEQMVLRKNEKTIADTDPFLFDIPFLLECVHANVAFKLFHDSITRFATVEAEIEYLPLSLITTRFTFIDGSDALFFLLMCDMNKCPLGVENYSDREQDCVKCPHLANITLNELVGQLEVTKIVKDYRIIRSEGKKFIPFSLVPRYCHEDWFPYIFSSWENLAYKFPYISLEPCSQRLKSKTDFMCINHSVREFIKFNSLAQMTNIKNFIIDEPFLESFSFPQNWNVSFLKSVIFNTGFFSTISLDFLKNAPQLEELIIQRNLLLETIDLNPLQFCTKLRKLDLAYNSLRTLDLGALSQCHKLRKINIEGNELETLDFTPLQKCTNLAFLDVLDQDFPDNKKQRIKRHLQEKVVEAKLKEFCRFKSTKHHWEITIS